MSLLILVETLSARISILKRGTPLYDVEQLSARHVEVLTDIIVRLDAGLLKLSLKRRLE